MSNITIRPDVRTAGGEVSDIMLDGQYVGTFTFVFRENDRMSGSVQLDKLAVGQRAREKIIRFIETYIQSLSSALNVRECDVLFTYSSFDKLLTLHSAPVEIYESAEQVEEDIEYDTDWVEEDSRLEDFGQEEHERIDMVHDEDDFDDYEIILARDDGDMLTYEIYEQSEGNFPIGLATVDISDQELTGFMEFRDKSGSDHAESIATILMQELDKEKQYETLNLTVLCKNEPIQEILFGNEQVH